MPTPETLILENQFGETTTNYILGGTASTPTAPITTKKVLANDTGGTAVAAGVAYQTFSDHLPAKTGVTAISALATPVTAITIALSTSDTYSDAAVNTAVNTALASVVADLQTQLTKVNAILAAMKVIT